MREQPTAPASPLPSIIEHQDPTRPPPSVVDGEVVIVVDDYQPSLQPRVGRWRVTAIFVALAALSLAIGLTGGLVISPLLFASAMITLTPESHTVATDASISLPVRLYPADHESLSRTVATTGTATRQATAARGSITFYNGLPAPQTVAVGTLLMSASGVPVLTQETAYIPAASPPTEGAVTVNASAENTGPGGNIAAGSIGGPCCRAYVLAYSGAFYGGVDARTYRTPTAHDIAAVIAPLRNTLDSRLQGALHAWLQPREVLLPPTCAARTSSSAQPGAEADHVTVTVGETCTATAYNSGELQQAATTWLSALAARQFGSAYRLATAVHAEVTGATLAGDRATLHLQVTGRCSYSLSRQALATLRAQLAGMNVSVARAMLHRLEGITEAQIQNSGATLPTDPGRIHMMIAS